MELGRAIDAVEQGLKKVNEDKKFPASMDPDGLMSGVPDEFRDEDLGEEEWSSKEEFIEYLETILIPDLQDSGSTATADDFMTAV